MSDLSCHILIDKGNPKYGQFFNLIHEKNITHINNWCVVDINIMS